MLRHWIKPSQVYYYFYLLLVTSIAYYIYSNGLTLKNECNTHMFPFISLFISLEDAFTVIAGSLTTRQSSSQVLDVFAIWNSSKRIRIVLPNFTEICHLQLDLRGQLDGYPGDLISPVPLDRKPPHSGQSKTVLSFPPAIKCLIGKKIINEK